MRHTGAVVKSSNNTSLGATSDTTFIRGPDTLQILICPKPPLSLSRFPSLKRTSARMPRSTPVGETSDLKLVPYEFAEFLFSFHSINVATNGPHQRKHKDFLQRVSEVCCIKIDALKKKDRFQCWFVCARACGVRMRVCLRACT